MKTVEFGGGSIMLWSCFGENGVGLLTVIERIMDTYVYVNILKLHLKKWVEILHLEEYKFQ